MTTNGAQSYEGGNYDRAIGTLGIDWSQDEDILTRYIERLGIVKGQTDLFGAIRKLCDKKLVTSIRVEVEWYTVMMIGETEAIS